MIRGDIKAIDVKRSLHDDYIERVDAEHRELVWTHPGMIPYYRNQNGKIRSVLPWRMVDYYHMTRECYLEDFHVTANPSSGLMERPVERSRHLQTS
jgi:4-hydroxyacetophenone monooxygenase